MTYSTARAMTGPTPRTFVARLLVVAVIAGLGYQFLPSSASPVASPIDVVFGDELEAFAPGSQPPGALLPRTERRGEPLPRGELGGALVPRPQSPDSPPSGNGDRGGLALADGAMPDGTTVFDDDIPGLANLDPALLRALRRAASAAADDGVDFFVNSGWRSQEYQEQLLKEAVSRYGSEREAARWVATPNTSAHVSGDAVDMGYAATAWLSEHGAEYGLCQIYRNELWHFELRPEAARRGCAPMYADPTHDPRMQG